MIKYNELVPKYEVENLLEHLGFHPKLAESLPTYEVKKAYSKTSVPGLIYHADKEGIKNAVVRGSCKDIGRLIIEEGLYEIEENNVVGMCTNETVITVTAYTLKEKV